MAGSSLDEGALALVLGADSPLGLSDGALVARFAAQPHSPGGEAAFATLVARHGALVERVCRQTLRSVADADDAYQAVWLVLARRAGSIREPDLLGPWLYGVALRTARLARRRGRQVEPLAVEPAARSTPCPLEANEASVALHAAVARLPEPQRQAVILCHWQGLTHDEAARRLGVPTSTVSVRLMRARERLRSALARRGFAPGSATASLLLRLPADGLTIPPRAWAALHYLRGPTTGEVPAGIASLASGVLAMSFRLSKIAAVALLASGLAATGAWSLAQTSAPPAPTQSPTASPKGDTPAPAPENPALAAFQQRYRLDPGQIVKRIPPPFAVWRFADEERRPHNILEFLKPENINVMIYNDRNGNLRRSANSFREPTDPQGILLGNLLDSITENPYPCVEGPADLLASFIEGDWVKAADATSAAKLEALNAILSNECHLPIRTRIEDLEREVVIARGQFQARPVLEDDSFLYIYGATLRPDGRAYSRGPLWAFLGDLGRHIEPHQTILNETSGPDPGGLSWRLSYRLPATEQTTREDRDATTVLRHVSEQTGLTFTTERRRVPVITVERTN